MGRDTDGPAFDTYDDFMTLSTETGHGAGFFEPGIVRPRVLIIDNCLHNEE